MARTGVRFVFVIVGLAAFMAVCGAILLAVLFARGPSVPDGSMLVLEVGGEVEEVPPDDVVEQFLNRDAATVRGLVETLRKAQRDPRIAGVLLRPTPLASPYWGKVQELRDAVLAFRRSGKPVVAFLEYGSDREYYLASAADRIVLVPTSPLDVTGVASYEVFLRGALDKVGAYPDFLHVGEYKTAVNQFTETGFTPEHREMTESLNRDMYAQLVRGIAEGRGKDAAEVQALIDQGPFTPQEALEHGFVDALAYDDQVDDRMREWRIGGAGELPRLDGRDYRRVGPRSVGIEPRSRIAVLYAVGTIVSGRSAFDPVNGPLVGSDTLVEQIRRVREDDAVRAIVLRVDSPGGSSVASDVIWRELAITRADSGRPLVASMGDLAASGGYYISMAAQEIVAQPATLTGSIGVFMGKIVLGGTAGKLGVATGTVTAGANADIYSPFTPFTDAQRAQLGEYMQGFYDTFVAKAAEARGTTPAAIHEVAQGRVWTGIQGKDHGLVDALGGLDTAVARAKALAGIPADEEVELVAYPPRRSFYEALTASLGGATVSARMWRGLLGADGQALAAASLPARLFRRGEPLALMPFALVR
ncbi:MAG: signal peptide peptidase SppA [Vicinamibacterales bacterium]